MNVYDNIYGNVLLFMIKIKHPIHLLEIKGMLVYIFYIRLLFNYDEAIAFKALSLATIVRSRSSWV